MNGLWHKADQAVDVPQNAYRKTTSSRGEATVTYSRDSDSSGVETIYAATSDGSITASDLSHYWVAVLSTSTTVTGTVLMHDASNQTIVVGSDGGDASYYEFIYDRNDQFNNSTGAINYRTFRDSIMVNDTITIVVSGGGSDTVNRYTLT